jgi:hypothetical protein
LPEKAGFSQPLEADNSTRSPAAPGSGVGRSELPSIRQKYFSFIVPNLMRSAGEIQTPEPDYRLLYLQAQEQLAAFAVEKEELQAERQAVQTRLEQILLNSVEPEKSTAKTASQSLLETASRVGALVRLLLLKRAGRRENIFRSQLEELLSQEVTGSGFPPKDPIEEEKIFLETLVQSKPRWKERSEPRQSPIDFLEQHYGEFLVRFGAPQNRLFQDQLRHIDRPLFIALTNYLSDRFSSLGLRPKDFIPPKSERVSARIEQGYADPRTTSARQQREHRKKLRQKTSGSDSSSP